jgi:uncharacterized repeat protein (TIGR03803 family)
MVCIVLVFCAAGIAAPAQNVFFTTLVNFAGGPSYGSIGASPRSSLIQASDGNFYGVTNQGGTGDCYYGCGTVFKITPGGALTTLHSFNGSDGAGPAGPLVEATDGNFYGTTLGGGNLNPLRDGTVYKMTPNGKVTVLHHFNGTDGLEPYSGLVQATDGNFYGTTRYGANQSCPGGGCGTVFKVTPDGTLTTLHSFDGSDGSNPVAGLVQASDGTFYGTTTYGGSNGYCDIDGDGTVFKLTLGGTLTTLYSFCSQTGCTDGCHPYSPLVQATDGNFYGTTAVISTVFKMTPRGTLTTLHTFQCSEGCEPLAPLVQATDGNFYGTNFWGGAYGIYGTVFAITPSGTLTLLHTFDGTDGGNPSGGLVQGTGGNFYGTTSAGGLGNRGTVFTVLAPR